MMSLLVTLSIALLVPPQLTMVPLGRRPSPTMTVVNKPDRSDASSLQTTLANKMVPLGRQPSPTMTVVGKPERSGTSSLRLTGLSIALIGSFVSYIYGSQLLNYVLVGTLGIARGDSGDAFGPFVTLLGLVYSVVLGQVYEYYVRARFSKPGPQLGAGFVLRVSPWTV